MNDYKFLIDTNIVIGLEDNKPVQGALADLMRLSAERGVRLFVEQANFADVMRDRDERRRSVTLSKLQKFPRLAPLPHAETASLEKQFGEIKSENDESDVHLLSALSFNAVDFLVTEDIRLHRRAERAGLAKSVFTTGEAVAWIQRTFEDVPVQLPFVIEKKAYQIDTSLPIFDSLRTDYSGFDDWFEKKCRRTHRDCWVLDTEGEIAGHLRKLGLA